MIVFLKSALDVAKGTARVIDELVRTILVRDSRRRSKTSTLPVMDQLWQFSNNYQEEREEDLLVARGEVTRREGKKTREALEERGPRTEKVLA